MLIAACGGGSDSAPPAANTAPGISPIADQSTDANKQSQPISFNVSDERVDDLSFDLSSDNQQVVPNDGLTLGGSDVNRTITITPVSDTLGDAFVTVIVTDSDGLSASTSFLLTITAEQLSMQQFTRMSFAEAADDLPELVNAVEFTQDADADDFADLLDTE
jgi:hypothetical protein